MSLRTYIYSIIAILWRKTNFRFHVLRSYTPPSKVTLVARAIIIGIGSFSPTSWQLTFVTTKKLLLFSSYICYLHHFWKWSVVSNTNLWLSSSEFQLLDWRIHLENFGTDRQISHICCSTNFHKLNKRKLLVEDIFTVKKMASFLWQQQ